MKARLILFALPVLLLMLSGGIYFLGYQQSHPEKTHEASEHQGEHKKQKAKPELKRKTFKTEEQVPKPKLNDDKLAMS
ncbi:MAG: hypothetical protein HQL32_05395 [Planctomycetes bacterium]|nr:hypothetical protein [Planctomycetota bacterium]